MLNLVLGTLAGGIIGCITGIVPGLHSNTAAGAAAALAVPLSFVFGVEGVCCMIVSLMVVHTFIDCIPSTFIGVPDPDTVLSVLPAHRMYLEGNGAAAVRISALGSLFGFVFCLPLFALFYFVLPQFQGEIDWAIGLIVLLAATLLIVFSRAPLWSLLLFLVSGGLGVFGMYFSYLSFGCFGMGEVLLPLLSGLFGIPVLLQSLKRPGTVVPQVFSGLGTKRGEILKSSLKGTSQALLWDGFRVFQAEQRMLFSRYENAGFILMMEDRTDIWYPRLRQTRQMRFWGIAALYAVGRMRSGSMAVLAEFNLPSLPLMLAAAGCAAAVGYFAIVLLSKTGTLASKIPQKPLALAVLILLTVLTAVLCGPFGIFLLGISTAAGLIPELTGISRLYCMGSIMIPVMLFTLGILTF